ncbi:Basic helix-loop-helix DNA-binding superfamily protein, putative isoform 3 [Hibiscus syriacus]|uniref:Basic helix-loop-helix DNA-binding superfamily protein, putative isoform 3 n=1 Tax=Hibiscus syriacus TaxID=106335 RepID=A0A6A2Y5F1_HIBSY|nr:transcription factor bHLH162-like [Hibiscus syriacus]KAE8664074.1 Basic helix-loop-helix DNA-binding superfamily protein, putative isoform 3 [Hibiscus syriacus]
MELQMERLAQNWVSEKGTKRSRCSSAKVERRIIEKNRRNHMKDLLSVLNSLLPNHNPKELLTLPEQIDVAVYYIKSLQTRLGELREKKDYLTGTRRSYERTDRNSEIRINESGSAMEVALATGLDDCQLTFHEMIRIFHEDGGEVVNANFWIVGDTVFHIVHAEIISSTAAKTIREKLNRFENGPSGGGGEEEVEQELSRCHEIHPET